MSLDKKTLKKIDKQKKLVELYSGDIKKYRNEIKDETDEKKIEKLNSKIEHAKKMILASFNNIGKMDGDIEGFINELSDDNKKILLEIFPYGLKADSLKTQKRRNQIIEQYKGYIKKIQKLREEYPAYDTSLSVREKLKNKIYKNEKDFGWIFLVGGEGVERQSNDPAWNYKEHFATSTEFTPEEREIMEYCYNVGKEYDAYFDERYGFIADIGKHISDTAGNMYENSQLHLAQRWTNNLWTKVFPDIIKYMNREDKLSKKELETEAKEMTKRFIEFIRDREALEEYLDKWNELKSSDVLNGYGDNKKNAMVGKSLMGVIGEEKTWFTYLYTQRPETEGKEGVELLLKYTYKELGLED